MTELPLGATEASRVRYGLARELAEAAPLTLGREVVLTGSASRGVADGYSDVEMVFYGEALPAVAEREVWLRGMGATEIEFDPVAEGDEENWALFRFHGVWFEAGWQVIAAHERELDAIVAGERADHPHLMMAWSMVHALPLRSVGLLERWQQKLAHYRGCDRVLGVAADVCRALGADRTRRSVCAG